MSTYQEEMRLAVLSKFNDSNITILKDKLRILFDLEFSNIIEPFSFVRNFPGNSGTGYRYIITQGCILAMGNTAGSCMDNFILYLKERINQNYEHDMAYIGERNQK